MGFHQRYCLPFIFHVYLPPFLTQQQNAFSSPASPPPSHAHLFLFSWPHGRRRDRHFLYL